MRGRRAIRGAVQCRAGRCSRDLDKLRGEIVPRSDREHREGGNGGAADKVMGIGGRFVNLLPARSAELVENVIPRRTGRATRPNAAAGCVRRIAESAASFSDVSSAVGRTLSK